MTKNKNLTLPDVIYLLRDIIYLLHSLLTSAYILFAYAFSLFSLSLKMHLNKKFTIKQLRTWLREFNDIKHNHSYKKILSSDYDARKVIFF